MTRQTIEKKLDSLVKQIVILRDKSCVCCGTVKNLTLGHYYTRGAGSTKYDLENCYAQCEDCNRDHETNRTPMKDHVLRVLGVAGYQNLYQRAWKAEPIKVWELEALYEELKLVRDAYLNSGLDTWGWGRKRA